MVGPPHLEVGDIVAMCSDVASGALSKLRPRSARPSLHASGPHRRSVSEHRNLALASAMRLAHLERVGLAAVMAAHFGMPRAGLHGRRTWEIGIAESGLEASGIVAPATGAS